MKTRFYLKIWGKMAENKLTIASTSDKMNICGASLYRKLHGKTAITLSDIAMMMFIFNCSFEELFTEEDLRINKGYVKRK